MKRFSKLLFSILLILIVVFLIGSYLFSITKMQTLTDEVRKETSGQFIQLSKGKIHYELSGPKNAQTVVLIHGFTTPYFVWDKNVEELTNAGFRVLRYDHYGRGLSDRPEVKYDRNLYDHLLIELLQKLNIQTPVHLVGTVPSIGNVTVSAEPSRITCILSTYPELCIA